MSSLYPATFLFTSQDQGVFPCVNVCFSAFPSVSRKLGDKANNHRTNSQVHTKCFVLLLQLKAATSPILPSGLRKCGIALPAEQINTGTRVNIYRSEILFLVAVILVVNVTFHCCNHHFCLCGKGTGRFCSLLLTFLFLLQQICCWFNSSKGTNFLP